jgi:hypothetical protein
LTRSSDFNLGALYAALDAQRRTRGLSWAQTAREISGRPERSGPHQISPSTITSTRTKAVAEGDSVLQMLRWLNRTPESFVPGHEASDAVDARLPEIPPYLVLRFNTRRLHAALNAQRIERALTWAEVAYEAGLTVSMLTHLAKGGRTGFPHVMRMARWLGRPAAAFTRAADR